MKNLAAFIIVVFSFFSYEINAQTTYLWSNGETTPSINVNPSVTTTYLVTITNNGVNYYDSLVITVNSNSVITGSNFVCINGTSQLSATYTPASSNPWSSSNTDVATVSDTGLVAGISSGTSTITYTNVDNCQVTKVITVTPQTTPTFNAIEPICSGVVIDALPNISTNGITGTWSPAINNNVTTTYTFTPDAGQCATTTTQTINITTPKVTSPISFVAPTTTVAALPNVTIGTQIWTSKNLDVSTYRDGTPIPQVTDPSQWENLTTGAWCYYNNDEANGAIYGKLYNWYAVAGIHDNDPNTPNKTLAPSGWHIPTNNEWINLTTFLGENIPGSNYGGKMKSTGTNFWTSPNVAATNESSFTGLPGGSRDMNGLFVNLGTNGSWWSSSEINTTTSWSRYLNYNNGNVGIYNLNKSIGYSVRCVKDAPQVGESYQGGIIAYLFQLGDFGYDPLVPHGIIVANNDLPVKYTWGPWNPTLYSQHFQSISNEIGRGKLNTDTILALGLNLNLSFPAAVAAKNYTDGIYNDWFLPSSSDLLIIKHNLADNNLGNFMTIPDSNGILSTGYWSSSLMLNYAGASAPVFSINSSVICGCAFFETYYVRAIRYF